MSLPLTFKAHAIGSFMREPQTGRRTFRLRIEDPASGVMVMQIEADEALFLDWITNVIAGDKRAAVTFYGVDKVGLEKQHLDIRLDLTDEDSVWRLGLTSAIAKIEPALAVGGWQVSEYSAQHNHHRQVGVAYRLQIHRYTNPGTPAEPEIEALRWVDEPAPAPRRRRHN